MAIRFDIGTTGRAERLPDGRLRAQGRLTRTGVFEYRQADGSVRREYRPDSEVFSDESLKTFEDAIVTEDHPLEMVNSRNARQYQVGQISGAPRRDGNHVAATIVVNDASVIDKMERGEKVELSCGYECDLIATPGISPDGARYDAIQQNIRGNHVALVSVGRAGPTARVRMDSANVAEMVQTMTEDEMKAALEAATARADALQAKLDAMPPFAKKGEPDPDEEMESEDEKEKPAFLKKKMAKADARIAGLEAELVEAKNAARDQALRADAAEKHRLDAVSNAMSVARARLQLEARASSILGDAFKADASDRDLMTACVKKVDGDDVSAEASDEFVRGLFAGAAKRHDAGSNALAVARVKIAPEFKSDASAPDEAAAYRRMVEDSMNAWKKES